MSLKLALLMLQIYSDYNENHNQTTSSSHRIGLHPSVKQLGCGSTPPSLRPWSSAGKEMIALFRSGGGGEGVDLSGRVKVYRGLVHE